MNRRPWPVTVTRFLPFAFLPLLVLAAQPANTVIPAGFSDVAVFATNSIVLKKDVELGGDVAVNDASSDPDLHEGVELSVDKDASIAGSLYADRVKLAKGAEVGGSVFTNDLTDKGATIIGGTFGVSLPVFSPLPLFFSSPAGVDDFAVVNNGSDTLAPGSYRDISIGEGGVLLLTGGDYHLRSIQVEQGGQHRQGLHGDLQLAAAAAAVEHLDDRRQWDRQRHRDE